MISRRLLRVKIIKALYAHINGDSSSVTASEKTLTFSVAKTYELYHLMLQLPVEVARYGGKIIDERKNKLQPTQEEKNPNMRFVENPIIGQLAASKRLNEFLEKNKLSWNRYPELIKNIYQSMTQKPYFVSYMEQKKCSYERHKEFLKEFYLNEIEECELLYSTLEEMSLWWGDDVEYAASHAMRTISFIEADAIFSLPYKELPLLPLYKDSDDAIYAKELFVKTLSNKEWAFELIEKFAQNWDAERIVIMDKIVLATALTEIKEFASIPLTVSMDEFIEIAKYYSTPGSSNFINGMLDKIVASLVGEGVINKELPSRK